MRVSIHAPRAGRDYIVWYFVGRMNVSIHAPRAGRDSSTPDLTPAELSFNPRAPRGARRLRFGT